MRPESITAKISRAGAAPVAERDRTERASRHFLTMATTLVARDRTSPSCNPWRRGSAIGVPNSCRPDHARAVAAGVDVGCSADDFRTYQLRNARQLGFVGGADV